MAETAPVPAKKAKAKIAKLTHSPYAVMMAAASKAMTERFGFSCQAILKYIVAHNKASDEKKAGARLKLALKKWVQAGKLKQAKGVGAIGSFKLAKGDAKPAAKMASKKPAAEKAAKKHTQREAAQVKVYHGPLELVLEEPDPSYLPESEVVIPPPRQRQPPRRYIEECYLRESTQERGM